MSKRDGRRSLRGFSSVGLCVQQENSPSSPRWNVGLAKKGDISYDQKLEPTKAMPSLKGR